MTLIPDMPTDDPYDDEPTTVLGVVPPPAVRTPLEEADAAVRTAARSVERELMELRAQRDGLADRIRGLVAEQNRLARLLRVLNDKKDE